MDRLSIGDNVVRLRAMAKITQEQLAEFIGVTKSAVSKWESGSTYPDILLLPRLASLFDVSVDELLGYEAQLTREEIQKIYSELSEYISLEGPMKTFERCREYVKKYYSCEPFLMQMVVFYINHSMLMDDLGETLQEATALCQRVRISGKDPELAREAIQMEAVIMLMSQKPQAVLDILGESPKLIRPDAEIIAAAYQQMGNIKKAREFHQILIYQYLLLLLGSGSSYVMCQAEDFHAAKETIKRVMGLIELFAVDTLNPNASIGIYFAAASIYATHGIKEETLNMLQRYVCACRNLAGRMELHGDAYFDHVDSWIDHLELGSVPVRNFKTVKGDMINSVKDYPPFQILKEEKKFDEILANLMGLEEL